MDVIPSGTAPGFRVRARRCAPMLLSLVCAASLAQQSPSTAERAKQLWEAGTAWHVMGLYERALEHDPAYPPALIGLELIKQRQPKRL